MSSWGSTIRTNRRAQVGALVLAVVCVVGPAAAALSWAKSEVQRRAQDAGVEVDRNDVTIGLGGSAVLRNMRFARGGATATIEEAEIEVALTSLLSQPRVERVVVRGVDAKYVETSGAPRHNDGPASDSAGAVTRVIQRLGGTPPEVVVERLSVQAEVGEREGTATLDRGVGRLGGDDEWRFEGAVRMQLPAVDDIAVPTSGLTDVVLRRADGLWRLGDAAVRFDQPAKIARGGRTVSVGGAGVSGDGDAFVTDITVDTGLPYVEGPVRVARVEAGPLGAVARRDLDRLSHVRAIGADVTIAGRAAPDAPSAGPAASWNERASRVMASAFSRADEAVERGTALGPARLVLRDSTIRVPALDATLAVREAAIEAGAPARVAFSLKRGEADSGELEVSYSPGEARVEVLARNFELAALERYARMPLSGTASGRLELSRDTADGVVAYPLEASARIEKLRFEKPVLAAGPVEPLPFELELAARWVPHETTGRVRPGDGTIRTSKGRLRVGKVELDVRPSVEGLQALPHALPERVEVEVALAETDVQAVVDAVPAAILGRLTGMQLAGSLAVSGRVEVPLDNPERMKWEVEPVLKNFRIVSLPHDVDVRRLLTSATFTLVDEKIGHELTVFVPAPRPGSPLASDAGTNWVGGEGCGSYVYVPLDQISPHLASGVFSTEDRGYLWHDGFNVHALRESLAANLAEGRIVRGGSTITMQLVKNLFLDRNRTFARKLREVFLVWLTESVVDVPKARLLELYFNVIEYGPEVRGIWHASTYFFGKAPRDLTVGEVAWFITTLAGPKIYHHQFVKREISENVWGRMRARIAMLYHNDYITELDLVVASSRPPAFRASDRGCGPGSGAPRPVATPEDEVLARELLRLRRSGVAREELSQLLGDTNWRTRTLAAGPPPGAVDWDALPLARDGHSWWRGR